MNPQPAISIRRANKNDLVSIVRLLADDPLGSQREKFQQPLPHSYFQAFEEIERDHNNLLVVVELDAEVIGTLQLTFIPYLTFQGGKRALIEAVRVDSRYRSQGIGRQLFDWAINQARAANCHMVQLTTNAARTEAQDFYKSLGFEPSHIGMKLHLKRLD